VKRTVHSLALRDFRRRKHYVVALPRPVMLHRIMYGSSSSNGYGGGTEVEEYYVNGFGPMANRCVLDNPYGGLADAPPAAGGGVGGASAGMERAGTAASGGAGASAGAGEPWGRLVEVDFALDEDEPDFSGRCLCALLCGANVRNHVRAGCFNAGWRTVCSASVTGVPDLTSLIAHAAFAPFPV
jgi:hypothetical protein